jgi:GT2 family glycosyltransferase
MADIDPPAVTTVVISRNRRQDLLATLPRHTGPVILVDNGSTDGTPTAVAAACPEVEVIALDTNAGALARNVGAWRARTRYVAFADDDSWWEPASVDHAVRLLDQHPNVGLLAARVLLGPEEHEDPICRVMATSPLPKDPALPGFPVRGFVACAVVVRRGAFLTAGGYDPVVFFGGEEARLAIDLAARGYELCYQPDLTVHHHPSTSRHSVAARHALIARNELLTAVMRRPWPIVLRTAARTITRPAGRAGLLNALPRVPAAVSARRRIPDWLEAELVCLGH